MVQLLKAGQSFEGGNRKVALCRLSYASYFLVVNLPMNGVLVKKIPTFNHRNM